MDRRTLTDFPIHFFEQSTRLLLCLLLVALLGAIGVGTGQVFLDLWHALAGVGTETSLHHGLKEVLIDALTVLAVVEVYRTAMAYFAEGRVKVTYIIDTVLVAVLTEVMAFWYRDLEPTRLLLLVVLVLSLMFVRIMAIRFSPKRRELAEGL